MADRVIMPKALDTNGDIVSGATAYFYESGTTTPLTVYTTAAGDVALGASTIADSSGTFVDVYSNEALRLDIKDSLSVSLPGFPSDSWYIASSAGVGASTITFSPIDGNDATNVQDAIGNNTAQWNAVTAYGKSLIAAATAALARGVLGLGDIATTDLVKENDFASGLDSAAPSQLSTKFYIASQVGELVISTALVLPVNGQVTFSHGLTAIPDADRSGFYFIWKGGAVSGFANGNRFHLSGTADDDTSGVTFVSTATQLKLGATGTPTISAADGSGTVALTSGNVDLYMWARGTT